jgi:NAD(P)-dependent dehydrogenase (short-subunit alcohol dehydrogenase family)
METENQLAIVTGGAAETGRAIAHRLGAEGCVVLVADVDVARGGSTAQEIREGGGRAEFVRVDLRVPADVHHLFATAETFGRLAILVNNAGGWGRGASYPAAQPEEWRATLEMNLLGPMLATQLAVERMGRTGGAIVNVASIAGATFDAYASPEYAVGKAGLIRLTTSLADLDRRCGVRVNCLVPDWIGTDRAHRELAAMTPEQRAAAPPLIPLRSITDAVVECIRDEQLAGRVLLLFGEEPPRLLDSDLRL